MARIKIRARRNRVEYGQLSANVSGGQWLEDGLVPDATSYRNKAAEMRRFAQEAGDAARRREFLDIARQYDKLARRAEERSADGGMASPPD